MYLNFKILLKNDHHLSFQQSSGFLKQDNSEVGHINWLFLSLLNLEAIVGLSVGLISTLLKGERWENGQLVEQ